MSGLWRFDFSWGLLNLSFLLLKDAYGLLVFEYLVDLVAYAQPSLCVLSVFDTDYQRPGSFSALQGRCLS